MQKHLFTLWLFLACTFSAKAQSSWTLTHQSTSGNYYGVCAVSKTKVVASGEWGQLYQSQDGGQSLLTYQIPGSFSIFSDIIFLNSQQGLAGGGCYFITDNCVENVIASTSDGGQSWQVEKIAEGLGVFNFLQAVSNGAVYALSDYSGLFRRNPQTLNWDSLGRPGDPQNGSYSGMQFLNANNGFVEHWGFLNGVNTYQLLYTADGGQTWSVADTDYRGTHYFLTLEKGFLLAAQGQLGRTTDGGQNWTIEQIFGENEALRKMGFVNAEIGYLTTWESSPEIGRIYRTSDGGDHWQLDFQQEGTLFYDFHFSDPESGYAIGNYNQIYRRSGSTAAHEYGANQSLALIPNPASDFTLLCLPEGDEFRSVIITDLIGREVQVIKLQVGQTRVNIPTTDMHPGVYLVAPEGRHNQAVKLVVSR